MVYRYNNMDIDIDDRILQGDKDCRNQVIDEEFIKYAISISTDDDCDTDKLTAEEIKKIVETLIIADIGDIIGYDYWQRYGLTARETDGNVVWIYSVIMNYDNEIAKMREYDAYDDETLKDLRKNCNRSAVIYSRLLIEMKTMSEKDKKKHEEERIKKRDLFINCLTLYNDYLKALGAEPLIFDTDIEHTGNFAMFICNDVINRAQQA